MSCPDRCSNNFKIKNFPDEIECVVSDKIKTPEGLRATLLVNGLSDNGVDSPAVLVGTADASGEIAAISDTPGSKNVILA